MALIKPSIIDPIQRGRQQGTSFFRTNGRTIARQIVIPVDPANELQTGRRSGVAAGSKTYAYELSESEQAAWDAASQFSGRGELEISAVAVTSQVIGQPFPKIRSAGANPAFAGVGAIEFNTTLETLRVAFNPPSPIANFETTMKINPPRPPTKLPNENELVVFRTAPAQGGVISLIADYTTRFGAGFPQRPAIMLEAYNFDKTIPAKGLVTQRVQTDRAVTNSMTAALAPKTMPTLGSVIIQVQAQFGSVAVGAGIPLKITAPDFSNTFGPTVQNFVVTNRVLTDTLGTSRRASITITLTTSPAEIVSVQLFPTVTI